MSSFNFDDDLHDISFQGPKAVDVLAPHTPIDIHAIKYFHQQSTTLFGRNCIISRTGFSGERGYEIFAKADDIVAIWDGILEHGKSENVMTGSFNCIDAIRIEAGLLFYPFDMDESNSPWEVGLGFAVSRDKQADYRGKEACMNGIGKEKVKSLAALLPIQIVLLMLMLRCLKTAIRLVLLQGQTSRQR